MVDSPKVVTAKRLVDLVTRDTGWSRWPNAPADDPSSPRDRVDPMASVDTVAWSYRICDHQGTASTRDTAHSAGIEHLTTEHQATVPNSGVNKPESGKQ